MRRFWQAGKTDPVATIHRYNRPLAICAASPDGRLLIAGTIDGMLRIYSLSGGEILSEWKAHEQAITSIVRSASAEIVATSGSEGTWKIWKTSSGGWSGHSSSCGRGIRDDRHSGYIYDLCRVS
ncbi:MAG: hypothetical protein WCF90_03630 [Methanomicrobiales archaeon]